MLEPHLLVTFAVAQVFGLLAVIFVIVAACAENDPIITRQVKPWQREELVRFLWHPPLMSIGLVYFFGLSAVIYRVLRSMNYRIVKCVHGGIHAASLACALAGLTFAYQFKETRSMDHFTSLHGCFGIITVTLFAIQWIISISAFLWPEAPVLIRTPGLAVHVCVGIAVFLSAITTTFTGLYMKTNTYLRVDYLPPLSDYYKTSAFFYFFYVLVIFFMVTVEKYKRPDIQVPTTDAEMINK